MRTLTSKRHVAIIGGGVFGCAIAYALARNGLQVTLFERDSIGAHASKYNAGNLNPLHGTPPSLIPFTLECLALHKTIYGELTKLDCAQYALQPSDRIHIGFDEPDHHALEKIDVLFNRYDNFSSKKLDEKTLRTLEPRLANDITVGVLTKGNFTVDSGDLSRSLAQGAVKLGATIITEGVIDVIKTGNAVTSIKTLHGITNCDDVIFATGPWVDQLNTWLGINLPLEPVKGELLLMRLPDQPLQYDVTWGNYSLYNRRANEVWIGGTFERVGFDTTPNMSAKTHMLAQAAHMLPCIEQATLLQHVVGLRPVSASGLPIIGRAKQWENVYIADGGGSKGVLLSVGIAQAIYDVMRDDYTSLSIEQTVIE